MEYAALKYIGAGLMAFGALGGAIGVGNIFAAFLSGIARNPGAEPLLKKYIYIGAGFAEALGILSIGVALILIYGV